MGVVIVILGVLILGFGLFTFISDAHSLATSVEEIINYGEEAMIAMEQNDINALEEVSDALDDYKLSINQKAHDKKSALSIVIGMLGIVAGMLIYTMD